MEELLDSGYRYSFLQNPDVVRTKEDALRDGINCVSLAHLALKGLFEYDLPSELGCAELYLDRVHMRSVGHAEIARRGDLYWFGVEYAPVPPESIRLVYDQSGALVNWRDFPVKHIAIYTGDTENGEPALLHATPIDGGKNVIWPLSKFAEYRRYRKLYGVSRLIAAS